MFKLKVCGMKYRDNILQLVKLKPDFIGFIFYEKSKRCFGNSLNISDSNLSEDIKKVGVFVNSSLNEVKTIMRNHQLDFAQLHGDESMEFCRELKRAGTKIIKVFQIDEDFDFTGLEPYKSVRNPFF